MNFDTKKINGFKEELKKNLTAEEPSELVMRLIDLHANRTNDGITRGFRNARAYYAIDQAYDVSQHQISPTLMRSLIDRNPATSDEAQALAKSFGIDKMITEVPDIGRYTGVKGAKDKPGYLLQTPAFFTIYVPVLLAYVKIRWGKLFNDRDLYPLYKYEPQVPSSKGRAVGKVVTARINQMSQQMNYRAVERDCIQKDLLYGQAISFPREAWYRETQLIDGKEVVVKEGVRFENPHPTRVGYDMTHPLYTLNSDTGVSWVFYWNMMRYGDIVNNKSFWLPKRKDGQSADKDGMIIPTGWRTSDDFTGLYQHLYPCTVKFPTSCTMSAGENSREYQAFRYGNTADTLDTGIDVTVFFHKLNPKEWGLYDYDHLVWHRFVYAGTRTLLYCEPIFYCPAVAYLYDYDAERARNSSLGFELLPFQDQFGNLLSQQLLTVKKNLLRIVAVNTDMVGADFQSKIGNFTENSLRGIEFFPYSAKEANDQGSDISKVFYPLPLQQQSTAETIGAMNSLISVLERLLGYSSQEVGASASHQQSAQEVNLIAGATSTRMQFTGGFIDDAIYARKKLLYYAMMNYGTDDIMVQVADITPGAKDALKEFGFEVVEDSEPGIVSIKGKKSGMVFEDMFSERDGANRSNDQQMAVMLTTFLDRLMSNPRIGAEIPTSVVFRFFNQVAEYLGLPTDMKLPETDAKKSDEVVKQEQQKMQQLIAQVVQQLVGPAMQQTGQAVEAISKQVGENQQQVEEALTQMAQGQQQQNAALTQVAGGQQQQNAAMQELAQRQQADEQAVQALMKSMDGILAMAASNPNPA